MLEDPKVTAGPDPGPGGTAGRTARTTGVAVCGVEPVYGHGLSTALQQRGLPSVVVRDLAGLAPHLTADARPLVVVREAWVAGAAETIASARGPGASLAVLLAGTEPHRYAGALAAGAAAVAPEEADVDDVVDVLVAASRGFTSVPLDVVRSLCETSSGLLEAGVDAADVEWLSLLRDGVTVANLARRNVYSEREMYRQLSRLYRRLGASSRTQALLQAQRRGLLDR